MLATRRSLVALVVICGALVVNAFVLAPFYMMAPSDTFSDTAAIPAFAWSQRFSWLLLTLLIPVLPALVHSPRRGTSPVWIVPVVQIAFSMQAMAHVIQGFVMPWLAPLAPDVVDYDDGGALFLLSISVWVFFLVANVAFAVLLWRSGHSKLGAVLMIIGAVATPAIGPFGAGLLALGMGLIAWQALRSRGIAAAAAAVPEPVAV